MQEYYGSEFYFFIVEHFTLEERCSYRNLVLSLQGLYVDPAGFIHH